MTSRFFAATVLVGAACLGGCGDGASRSTAEAEEQARLAAEAEIRVRAEAAAALEAERLAALWIYNDVPVDAGHQLTASIYSTNDIDTDGRGARRVRLVFRDHPEWGRSAYLLLPGGDFDCYGGCRVPVAVDGAEPNAVEAHRPETDDAIAMFIDDAEGLWKLTAGASELSVEFPVTAGGTRTASFEVSGLDRTRIPDWD